MKKLALFIAVLLFTASVNGKNLQARLATASFFAPGTGPYIETYLSINGYSTTYTSVAGGKFQSAIEVTLVFRQGDKVAYFDKYKLLSPETTDTLKNAFNFMDVQRVPLASGTYTMELSIRDFNATGSKPYSLNQEVIINFQPNVIAISDIELLRSFTASTAESKLNRNGYELVPLIDNFFAPEDTKLAFFAEIYNTSSIIGTEPYVVSYHIETYENKRVLNDYSRILRQSGKPVNTVLTEIDIKELPSGNYNLVMEVRNKQNELLAMRELFFQRSAGQLSPTENAGDFRNTSVAGTFVSLFTDKDSLAECIRMLWPISTPNENTFALNQLQMADLKLMQQFFYDFWTRRNAKDPQAAWNNYYIEVQKVNQKYGAYKKKGYMTERGRVYLQYGPPDQLTEVYNEPNSYPYEIWQYYKLVKLEQTNRKFVFYNPELATNDFRLLHSDARGEVSEPQWQLILKRRNEKMNDFDQNMPRSGFGNQSNQIYNNPR